MTKNYYVEENSKKKKFSRILAPIVMSTSMAATAFILAGTAAMAEEDNSTNKKMDVGVSEDVYKSHGSMVSSFVLNYEGTEKPLGHNIRIIAQQNKNAGASVEEVPIEEENGDGQIADETIEEEPNEEDPDEEENEKFVNINYIEQ